MERFAGVVLPGRAVVPLLFVLLATLLPSLLPAATVAIQTPPPPDSTRPDTVDAVALAPLVVRVLRTPVSLGHAPLSVSLRRGEELREGKAGWSLTEALQAVPGLQVQNRYNLAVGERIILRGLGARTQFGVRGVRVVVDGIPATLPDGQSTLDHLDLPSLGAVEVLRGPASSLYGNGAGGVLRFRSRSPSRAPVSQEATLLAGGHGLRRASSLTSGTVEGTGYLVSLERFHYDGFRPDPLAGEGLFAGGPTYGEARRWSANLRLTRPLGPGALGVTVNVLDLEAENPGSLSRELLEEGRRQAYPFNVLQGTGKEIAQEQAGVSWEGTVGSVAVEVAGHAVRRDLRNPIPPAIVEVERTAGGLRAGLRGTLEVGPTRLTWTGGVDVESQDDDRRNLENEGGEAGELLMDQNEEVLGRGAFVQGILETGLPGGGRSLEILGGVRYQTVRFRVRDRFTAGGDPDDSGSRTMDAFSPTLGVRVGLTPWLDARGSVSTLFQTPTTSELANRPSGAGGFNPGLEPQEGTNLELGLRARRGEALQVDAAFFRLDLRRELVPFQVPAAPGRSYYRNAGTSRHRGVEVGAHLRLSPHLRLRGSYTWTDARFRSFSVEGEALDGNRIPGLAPHRAEGIVSWEKLLAGTSREVFGEVRLLYRDGVPANDRNTASARPVTLLDLRGGLRDTKVDGVAVSPYFGVTNLLNRRYTSAVAVNAFGERYFEPGPGRSAYLGLRVELGG